MTNYCSVGKIVAAFGVNGEMVLQHHFGKKTALKGLDALFIEKHKDELLPYFIEEARIKSDQELYIRIEGINTREAAQALIRKQVWLPEDQFHKYVGSSSPVSFLGFHIMHEDEDLGEVLEVIEQPHQVICRIMLNDREVLIPIHDETLLKVDKKNRRLIVKLPDGLLDIFR